MNQKMIANLIFGLLLCVGFILPTYAESMIIEGNQSPSLIILAKTDRGYYTPGDTIQVKGEVRGEFAESVPAELVFHFQGMNKTARSDPDGAFLVSVPISLIEPENLYRLVISARTDGYPEKNMSLPIVIMGEPSSLAPAPDVPDEFMTR